MSEIHVIRLYANIVSLKFYNNLGRKYILYWYFVGKASTTNFYKLLQLLYPKY